MLPSAAQLERIHQHHARAASEGGVWQAVSAADVPVLLAAYRTLCQQVSECHAVLDHCARHYAIGAAQRLLAEHGAFDWPAAFAAQTAEKAA